MTDYQKGRTEAVFNTGSKVEVLKSTYELEAKSLESMKTAFGMAGAVVESYVASIDSDLKACKLPLKEAEVAKKHVRRCVEHIRTLFNDAEAKRLRALGAQEALEQAVQSIKRLYDDENSKLKSHVEWESNPEKDLIDRPVGADPTLVENSEIVVRKKRKKP